MIKKTSCIILEKDLFLRLKKYVNITSFKYEHYINLQTSLFLIVFIPVNVYNRIKINCKSKKDLLQFIINPFFYKNIENYFYIIYNYNSNIINFIPTQNSLLFLKYIISGVLSYFPKNATLSISSTIRFVEKNKNILLNYNFSNPLISYKNPTGFSFSSKHINLFISFNLDYNSRLNDINYVLNQYNNKSNKCTIHIQLTDDTIKLFKSLLNKNVEFGGELQLSKIHKKNNNIIYVLENNRLKKGESNEIQLNTSRFTFHTHPKNLYKYYNVKYGWPSLDDFLAFIDLDNTILHFVISVEGIYTISYNKKWTGNIKKNFIKNNYNVDKENNTFTPEKYTKYINNIFYKKKPIFYVKYIPWNKATLIYSINYPKDKEHCCIPSQSTYNFITI